MGKELKFTYKTKLFIKDCLNKDKKQANFGSKNKINFM